MSDRLNEIEAKVAEGRPVRLSEVRVLVRFAQAVRTELDQPNPETAVIAQALDALEGS